MNKFDELKKLENGSSIDYILNSETDTSELAQEFSKILEPGDNVFLIGELGAGKTFFTRELVKSLGFKDFVNSPSFKLINEYIQCPDNSHIKEILHFDLYRLDNIEEVEYLGWEEYMKSDKLCIVEWAEKAKEIWLPKRFEFYFKYHESFDLMDKTNLNKRNVKILTYC